LIAYHLERHGAVVEIAVNGREALERGVASMATARPYDAILMDIQMPELDGFAATRQLRERGYTGPIIALTASTMRDDRDRCLAAGMNDHVSKPITPPELIAVLTREMVDRHGAGRLDRAVAQSSTPPSGIDHAAMRQRFAESPELLDEVIELFIEESGRLIRDVRRAVAEDDRETVGRHAHTLKGCAGNFMARGVTRAAETVGRLAENGDAQALPAAVIELDRELVLLWGELRQLTG